MNSELLQEEKKMVSLFTRLASYIKIIGNLGKLQVLWFNFFYYDISLAKSKSRLTAHSGVNLNLFKINECYGKRRISCRKLFNNFISFLSRTLWFFFCKMHRESLKHHQFTGWMFSMLVGILFCSQIIFIIFTI